MQKSGRSVFSGTYFSCSIVSIILIVIILYFFSGLSSCASNDSENNNKDKENDKVAEVDAEFDGKNKKNSSINKKSGGFGPPQSKKDDEAALYRQELFESGRNFRKDKFYRAEEFSWSKPIKYIDLIKVKEVCKIAINDSLTHGVEVKHIDCQTVYKKLAGFMIKLKVRGKVSLCKTESGEQQSLDFICYVNKIPLKLYVLDNRGICFRKR